MIGTSLIKAVEALLAMLVWCMLYTAIKESVIVISTKYNKSMESTFIDEVEGLLTSAHFFDC